MNIPLSRPSLGSEELKNIEEVLKSGWITQGSKVLEFETQFAAAVEANHAVAVSNCTDALSLALRAVGVGIGDIVLTVSHSFIATANSIRAIGAEPYFVDIDLNSYGMCPTELESILSDRIDERDGELYILNLGELITPHSPLERLKNLGCDMRRTGRVGAISVVHQMGIPANIDAIAKIAERFNIPLVEDAACALGSRFSRPIGNPFGAFACFSLHPRKVISTGEGGIITTNDKSLADKLRLMRHNGMQTSDLTRHFSNSYIQESYPIAGENSKMTDVQAAIGLAQLARLQDILAKRRNLGLYYQSLLSDLHEELAFPKVDHENWNYQSFPVRFLKRDFNQVRRIVEHMFEEGIGCRHGIMNAHQEQPYLNKFWNLSTSKAARDSTILLPIFADLDHHHIDYICAKLKSQL